MTGPFDNSGDRDELFDLLYSPAPTTQGGSKPGDPRNTLSMDGAGNYYRPYDRLISLQESRKANPQNGNTTNQMLMEMQRLRKSGGNVTSLYKEFDLVEAYDKQQKWGSAFLVGVGKALQPFQAPQQIMFGAVGSLTDLIQGDSNPGEKLSRATKAASGFLTYGLVNGTSRADAVMGKDLMLDWGARGTLANVGGGLLDFFGDPAMLAFGAGALSKIGAAGRLGSLGKSAAFQKMTNMLAVVDNVAEGAIKNPTAFKRAMGEIVRHPLRTVTTIPLDDSPLRQLASQIDLVSGLQSTLSTVNAVSRIPFSASPVKQAWQAIPLGARMRMGEEIGSAIEATRFRSPLGGATAATNSLAENWIPAGGR